MARADKIAAKMAADIMARQTVNKAAGAVVRAWSHQGVLELVTPAAYLIAEIEKSIKRRGKLLKAMDRQTKQVAALAAQVPGSAGVERRFMDLNEREFGVRLAEAKAPPKVNGTGLEDDPPGWLNN